MLGRHKKRFPDDPFPGFVIQGMVRRPEALMLMVGISRDPIFGPVIRLDKGSVAGKRRNIPAVGLPPLNMALADEVIAQAGITESASRVMGRRKLNMGALRTTLVQLSQLIIDVPEVRALDINPLVVDGEGVLVLDARMAVEVQDPNEQLLAIRPYPREQEERHTLPSGREIVVRPIRPEDKTAYNELLSSLEPEDLYMRFCGEVHTLPDATLAQLVHIDYDREMTFVATAPNETGEPELLGVVDTMATPDGAEAEFSILLRSTAKGQRLGYFLLKKMVEYCRQRGVGTIFGLVLKENDSMLGLSKKLGFNKVPLYHDPDMVRMELPLQESSQLISDSSSSEIA